MGGPLLLEEGMDNVCVVDIAVEPTFEADKAKLGAALAKLATESGICVRTDEESGQIVISGTSEEHLDAVVTQLRGEVAGGVRIGMLQVAYRETVTRAVEQEYTHKALGEFARIKFRIAQANTVGFINEGTDLPADYVAAIRKGVEQVMGAGPIIGFPLMDVVFTLENGAWHDVESSAEAFEVAGRRGFQAAIEKAGPSILEPIMRLSVRMPEIAAGKVISDINLRRGQVRGVAGEGMRIEVEALVPLATMFGYRNSLGDLTLGAGSFELTFDHYERLPNSLDPDDRFPPAMAMRA